MGAMANRSAGADRARRHGTDLGRSSDGCSRRAAPCGCEETSMKDLGRLLHFSRPYAPYLVVSVLLMACVGAAQALTALLIGPVFDRVLNPSSADTPVLLFTI